MKSERPGAREDSGFRAPGSPDEIEDGVAPDGDEAVAIVSGPEHSA